MAEKFQLVMYYKKRVVIGGKPSLDTMIIVKKKFAGFDVNDNDDMNALLDEYSANKKDVGREEFVSTWTLVYDDDDFIENILKLEQDESFVEWEERSTEIIKQKILDK